MNDTQYLLWLVQAGVGVGGGLIMLLLNRAISRMDADLADHKDSLDGHDAAITDLKVGVARAQAGTEALAEQMRQVRHDLRDVKQGVDGIARHLMGK